jgi:hypothetical protein
MTEPWPNCVICNRREGASVNRPNRFGEVCSTRRLNAASALNCQAKIRFEAERPASDGRTLWLPNGLHSLNNLINHDPGTRSLGRACSRVRAHLALSRAGCGDAASSMTEPSIEESRIWNLSVNRAFTTAQV